MATKVWHTTAFWLLCSLGAGVLFRELTKHGGFEGRSTLSLAHPHIMVLGFFMFIAVILLDRVLGFTRCRWYTAFYYVYNLGLVITVGCLVAHGVMTVRGGDGSRWGSLSYLAGAGHVVLSAGLLLFLATLRQALKPPHAPSTQAQLPG